MGNQGGSKAKCTLRKSVRSRRPSGRQTPRPPNNVKSSSNNSKAPNRASKLKSWQSFKRKSSQRLGIYSEASLNPIRMPPKASKSNCRSFWNLKIKHSNKPRL